MKNKHIREMIGLFCLLMLFGVFFQLLYSFNNKYGDNEVQPENGCITISEEQLAGESVHFLYRDWEFYYQALLTPEDIRKQDFHGAYMEYVTIGQVNNYAGTNPSRLVHGCGTYVMHVTFPKEKGIYTIEIPEVYSSYRFYTNDELIGNCGNPGDDANDEKDYYEQVQNCTYTFEAAGECSLILATRDMSHFYSGVTYPPALGKEAAVSHYLYLKFLFAASVVIVCIISGILTLYYWKIFRKSKLDMSEEGGGSPGKTALIFAFLSLLGACSTSYPILHSLYPVKIHPLYTIEMVSGYLISLLIVVLYNRLTRIDQPFFYIIARVMESAAVLMCIAAFVYSSCSAYLDGTQQIFFSQVVDVYKIAVAIYLLARAGVAVKYKFYSSRVLFASTLFYACCYIWDRIYKGYEPIYGGWFAEWAVIVMILTCGYLLWRTLLNNYQQSLMLEEKYRQITHQTAIQIAYNAKVNQALEQNRRLRHDFRHHLAAIRQLSDHEHNPELSQYIGELTKQHETSSVRLPLFCEVASVNALLQYYYDQAVQLHISVELEVHVGDRLPIDEIEFCTILGNLLENALEASRKTDTDQRMVCAKGAYTGNMYVLYVENSHCERISRRGDAFFSTKHEGTGIGTWSIRKIVKKYNGMIDFNVTEERFCVKIALHKNIHE